MIARNPMLIALTLPYLACFNQEPASKPASSESPKVCVSRMQITRTVALYDDPYLMPTCFEFELFINPGKGREIGQYAVRILELDEVFDDTGQSLLTDQRQKENRALRERVTAVQTRLIGNVMGPVLPIRLDIPDAKATVLKRVRGKIEVASTKINHVEIKNILTRHGQSLDHPDLKGLEITVEVDQGATTEITLVFKGDQSPILEWAVGAGGKYFTPFMRASSDPGDPRTEQSQSFDVKLPKDISLWLAVAVPQEARTAVFDFSDIPLP